MFQGDSTRGGGEGPARQQHVVSSDPDMQSIDALERTNSLARREVAKMETAQMRSDRHNATRHQSMDHHGGTGGNSPYGNGGHVAAFEDNVARMQKVWAAQEAQRVQGQQQQQQQQSQQHLPPMQPMQHVAGQDVIFHNGTKYERKQTGPFVGKLVSAGSIISIDGEDYVEYRVLTKPVFF